MEERILIIAPHPDDEVLGAGGMLLRRKAEGAKTAWLIVTEISVEHGWSGEKVEERAGEIKRVSELFGFDEVFMLNLPTQQLDHMPMSDLVAGIAKAFNSFRPQEVLLPHYADAHSDHRVVFNAAAACTKWFRYPFVQRVLAYETVSETEFGLEEKCAFNPNFFVDISEFLERKLEIMAVYKSELGNFPFPRSLETVRALAAFRGANSGFAAAEAFQLLRQRY